MKVRVLLVMLIGLSGLACDKAEVEDRAREIAVDAKERAGELAEDPKVQAAKERAGELAGDAKERAGELAGDAFERTKSLWAERKGELSERGQKLLRRGAEASGEDVVALLDKGVQLAPVAFDIAKTLHESIDSDVDIEPIVQAVDDPQAQAELDARISDMPRVETINGLDVGFKDVSQWDSGGRETESAYLILWRKGDRLYGLIYRSRSRVNIDKIVEEAPRLIDAVQGAL